MDKAIKVQGAPTGIPIGTRVFVTRDLDRYAYLVGEDTSDYLRVRFDMLYGTPNYVLTVHRAYVYYKGNKRGEKRCGMI